MNQEQAESYKGKTVYVNDYQNISVTPCEVVKISEVRYHDSSMFELVTEDGGVLFDFYEDYNSAVDSIVKHYEIKVTAEMKNLKEAEALKLVGL